MYWSPILLVLAGLAGPLRSNGRRPLMPVVVGDLLGGIVLGRTGLGALDPTAGAMPAFYGLALEVMTVLREGVRDGMILAAARDPNGWWEDRPEP